MRDSTAVWSLPKRLGFLVLAIFLILNAVPQLAGVVPVLGDQLFLTAYQAVWNVVVVWLGEHVLGLPEPITVLPNGSGDTTWNYVQLFGMVMLSLIVGVAWAFADRKRANHSALNHWLMVLVRYALASAMLVYGLIKLFKSQFPFPSLTSLTSTYGESSPMGLVWNFMGYSTGYNLFAGGAEVLAGVLLLWRRTTTLGALVAVGVTAHIAALNFCYDIPVKLFSSTLLLMAIYLFANDLRRFVDVLVLGRAAAAVPLAPHFASKRGRIFRRVFKGLFVLLMTVTLAGIWFMSREDGDDTARPPLYGLYKVESFSVDGVARPPLTTDAQRWQHFIVEAQGFAVVRTMDSEREFFAIDTDPAKSSLVLHRRKQDSPGDFTFTYEQPTPEQLILRGTLDAGALEVNLRKVDPSSFLLVSRGFRWVNEYPFNR